MATATSAEALGFVGWTVVRSPHRISASAWRPFLAGSLVHAAVAVGCRRASDTDHAHRDPPFAASSHADADRGALRTRVDAETQRPGAMGASRAVMTDAGVDGDAGS